MPAVSGREPLTKLHGSSKRHLGRLPGQKPFRRRPFRRLGFRSNQFRAPGQGRRVLVELHHRHFTRGNQRFVIL